MERLITTMFFTLISLLLGAIFAMVSFTAAWAAGESPVLWWMVIAGSASCYFFVPHFFTGINPQSWYLYTIAVALPGTLVYGGMLIDNLNLGHVPIVVATPLVITLGMSFAGGYLKWNRRLHPTRPER